MGDTRRVRQASVSGTLPIRPPSPDRRPSARGSAAAAAGAGAASPGSVSSSPRMGPSTPVLQPSQLSAEILLPEFHVHRATGGGGSEGEGGGGGRGSPALSASATRRRSPSPSRVPPTAYVLEWGGPDGAYGLSVIDGPEALRREIGRGRDVAPVRAAAAGGGGGGGGGGLGGGDALGINFASARPPAKTTPKGTPPRRLFVLHGLPAEYVAALRTSLDVDPAFLEAHAGRRRYRPLRWRRDARFACFAYPEMVVRRRAVSGTSSGRGGGARVRDTLAATTTTTGPTVTVAATPASPSSPRPVSAESVDGRARGESYIELMDVPVVRAMGTASSSVVFCRASLWMAPQADILLLDRPLWRDGASTLHKARRPSSVTRPYHLGGPRPGDNLWDVQLAEGAELPDLQDALYDALKDAEAMGDGLVGLLSGLAFDHWLDFFEILPPPRPESSGTTAENYDYDAPGLLWQVAQSLEHNLDLARSQSRYVVAGDPSRGTTLQPDWQLLLDRATRRIDLSRLSFHNAVIVPPVQPPSKPANANPSAPNPPRSAATAADATSVRPHGIGSLARPSARARLAAHRSSHGPAPTLNMTTAPATASRSPDDQDQRSLDRVTYLGGFLLPFSVVSGILSMNDQYSPTGGQFWIFWVAGSLSAVACLLVIYLDQLATLEAWFEVAADDAVGAILQVSPSGRTPGAVANSRRNKLANGVGLGASLPSAGNGGLALPVFEPVTVQSRTYLGSVAAMPEARTAETTTTWYTPATGETHTEPSSLPVGAGESDNDVSFASETAPQEFALVEEEVLTGTGAHPTMIVQRRSDGSAAQMWRKQPLGWSGALKRAFGYYRWKGTPNVRFSPPGLGDDGVDTVDGRVRTL